MSDFGATMIIYLLTHSVRSSDSTKSFVTAVVVVKKAFGEFKPPRWRHQAISVRP